MYGRAEKNSEGRKHGERTKTHEGGKRHKREGETKSTKVETKWNLQKVKNEVDTHVVRAYVIITSTIVDGHQISLSEGRW